MEAILDSPLDSPFGRSFLTRDLDVGDGLNGSFEEFYDKIHNGKNKQVSLNAQAASFVPNKVKLTTKSVSKKKGNHLG